MPKTETKPTEVTMAKNILFMNTKDLTPGKNPRRAPSKEGLQELAESIKQFGVLSPILAYRDPKTRKTVIIAGHRRFQAAAMVHSAVPVIILAGDSKHRAEISLVENIQREDLSPMDEAEAMKAVSKSRNLGAGELAEIFGKSESYVYRRLRLLDLSDKERAMVKKGEMSLAVAVVLLRISDLTARAEAVQILEERECLTDPKDASETVAGFMTDLSKAPWSLEDIGLVQKAGPCTTCPKRSTAQVLLFDTREKTDRCLDAACFKSKQKAWEGAEAQRLKNLGARLVRNVEGMRKGWNGEAEFSGKSSGLVILSETCREDPKRRTWEKLIGKVDPKILTVIKPAWGGLYKAIPATEALKLARARGFKTWREQFGSSRTKPTASETRHREESRAQSIAWGKAAKAAGSRLRTFPLEAEAANKALDALSILAVEFVGHEGFKRYCETHGLKPKKHKYGGKDWEGTVRARIGFGKKKENFDYATASVVELLLMDPRSEGWMRATRKSVLKVIGVDMAAIQKEELQKIREARKARTKKTKTKIKPKARKVRSSRKK